MCLSLLFSRTFFHSLFPPIQVIKTVDVSYGMDPGFNQAIELSAESLANVKLVQEKKLLQRYFDEISQDTGKYCFMVEDTLRALDMSAVETLIVWENLTVNRITVKNSTTFEEQVLHLTPDQVSGGCEGVCV